jgi:hypothetical protein
MNIFIDCEFNGFGGDLISMALVAEDGREFYEVLNLEKDRDYELWVFDHVVPFLNKDPISKDAFQAKLWAFINRYKEINLIADWPDDIKYFCMSLIVSPGVCINTPPKLTMEINRELSSKTSAILHNALEDAKAIQQNWNELYNEQPKMG